jgi:LmbE family N-acetylglucosaminyl deacetylase
VNGSSVGHEPRRGGVGPTGDGGDGRAGDRQAVVFVHAHPDDEAIFTGGTMAQLAADGHRVVLVVCTGGELGVTTDLATGADALAAQRRHEVEAAAGLLGVDRVVMLGYVDSGMAGDPANDAAGSFWSADVELAAKAIAEVVAEERAAVLVGYDEGGMYGHPDHVQVHRVSRRAADLAGLATTYDATVDREYLHFVETHLVEEAALAGDLGLVRSHIGVATVDVTTVVDARPWLAAKRAAMAAHASQITESASALQLPHEHFADVYGWEWYVRSGPPALLDRL